MCAAGVERTVLLSTGLSNDFFIFFFFKQKTAYEIVSRDWSSDVCSSDLKSLNWLSCGDVMGHQQKFGSYFQHGLTATRCQCNENI